MEAIISLALVITATAIIIKLGPLAQRPLFNVSRLHYINTQLTYQALLLGLSALVLSALYFVDDANLVALLTLGNIAAAANGVSWLGIPDGLSWRSLGAYLSVFITLGTLTFIYLQFRKSVGGLKPLLPYLPWVVLFSLTNSFAEEIVYRLGVIVPLVGHIETGYILLLSAILFGAPHLRGMPNGIVGALMAGFLGWLLAKSVIETDGIFWAWLIHFLQDIPIFSAFILAAANSARENGTIRATSTS